MTTPLQQGAIDAANSVGIDPGLFSRLIGSESAFNPVAYNPASGAFGIAQFMPGTAAMYGISAADPRDPIKELNASASYFKTLMDKFGGNAAQAVAAYKGFNPSVVNGIPDGGIIPADVAKVTGDSAQTATANDIAKTNIKMPSGSILLWSWDDWKTAFSVIFSGALTGGIGLLIIVLAIYALYNTKGKN